MLKRLLFAAAMSAALVANGAVPSPLSAQAPISHRAAFQPTRFSVIVEGSGPDLILIPGLTSSRHVFDQAVAGLGGRYRVHRIQVAGFGGEPARGNGSGPVLGPVVEEIHAYIAANHLRHPMVAGHSVGGLMTLMLAQRHPEDVSRALIVDALPFYGMLMGPQATPENLAPQVAPMRDSIAAMSDEAWRAQQTATATRLASTPQGQAELVADSMASDRGVVARALYEDATTDMRPVLPQIRTPLTVAYAVNPFATEATYGALMHSGYATAPNVRLIAVEPSYHFIMLDQPARFQQILDAFLRGDPHCGETRTNDRGEVQPRLC
jgi:pimeloyl-ACP methyl ester carboxylesterase